MKNLRIDDLMPSEAGFGRADSTSLRKKEAAGGVEGSERTTPRVPVNKDAAEELGGSELITTLVPVLTANILSTASAVMSERQTGQLLCFSAHLEKQDWQNLWAHGSVVLEAGKSSSRQIGQVESVASDSSAE